MRVKLIKKYFDYLINNLLEKTDGLVNKLNHTIQEPFVYIELDDNTADEIRDLAMDKQVYLGFDADYELTPEGEILQELTDAFYIG